MSKADDEAQIRRLDDAWNQAYLQNDRAPLADILAEDFTGFTAAGEPIDKASLMLNPMRPALSAIFGEQSVRVFGDTAISRGRLEVELEDHRVDLWFLRVFARREGFWRAVSAAVTPVV
jgi:ketosteroid isomerase-like protein